MSLEFRRQMMAMDEILDGPREPVLLLTPRWSEIILVDPGRENLCFVEEDDLIADVLHVRALIDKELLSFSVPIHHGAYELNRDGSMSVFGLRKLGPGTWLVQPSINMPELVHAFVVMCAVPEPAPWEKSK